MSSENKKTVIDLITTLSGDITREKIENILPHEHLFYDMRPFVSPIDDEDFYKKLTLSNFGKVSRNPYAVLENAAMDEDDVILEEMKILKKAGCNLLVDATTSDFGRDVKRLKRISDESGVMIVAGCGWYYDASISDEDRRLSEDAMFEIMMKEINEGIDGTDMKAGLIGEVGTSANMTPFEEKSVRVAAKVQKETGLGMHIHCDLWNREGLKALDIALKAGANPSKVCINHTDVVLDKEYILEVLNRGAIIEFDNFGKEYYCDKRNRNLLCGSFATDIQRAEFIRMLVDMGYEKQLLITNDICLKSMTHTYGGWGFDHIFTNIVPMLEDIGIPMDIINLITTENSIKFIER